LAKATKNARQGKAFVSGLLFGTESVFAEGPMGDIERRTVESEGLERADFQIVGLREASSKGTRREILAPFRDLDMVFGERSARFAFELNKGCYATAMLREFMKADITSY
jgi:tRNA pseudouridine13 synthase